MATWPLGRPSPILSVLLGHEPLEDPPWHLCRQELHVSGAPRPALRSRLAGVFTELFPRVHARGEQVGNDRPNWPTLISEVADMIRTMRRSANEHHDRLRYWLVGMLVTWFVPAAVRLDELDPILGAHSVPGRRASASHR